VLHGARSGIIEEVYGTLAEVYDFLVPESVLSPEGSAAAFATVTAELAPGARVLDCACGTGTLAVGLALAGFVVAASDASPEMVERTRALAAERDVDVESAVRRWEDLAGGPYDAVLCVGNSLTHAPGRAGRSAALAGMRAVLRERSGGEASGRGSGGLLAVTSRNWERPQAAGQDVVERGGRRARVCHTWHAGEPPVLEVAVTFDDGTRHSERLEYWPFTHDELDDDLRAAGFEPVASTYTPDVERYLVSARAGTAGAAVPG
jgi:SAM-dependent methyltransferase